MVALLIIFLCVSINIVGKISNICYTYLLISLIMYYQMVVQKDSFVYNYVSVLSLPTIESLEILDQVSLVLLMQVCGILLVELEM